MSRFSAELSRSLEKLKMGNARTPAISPTVLKMLTGAWAIGSIDFDASEVRTGFTVLALAADDELVRLLREVSREFEKIQVDSLRKNFVNIVAGSNESASIAAPPRDEAVPQSKGKSPNLEQFTVNLTENARLGRIDPVLGRDFEIRQLIEIGRAHV